MSEQTRVNLRDMWQLGNRDLGGLADGWRAVSSGADGALPSNGPGGRMPGGDAYGPIQGAWSELAGKLSTCVYQSADNVGDAAEAIKKIADAMAATDSDAAGYLRDLVAGGGI